MSEHSIHKNKGELLGRL